MGRLRRAARRNARLQYRPVLRGLRRESRSAKQTYRVGRRQARQDARDISSAALAAVPQVRKDYRQATKELRFANRLGGDVGEGLFAEMDAASRRDYARALAGEKVQDVQDLRQRAVRAREAGVYGTQSLFDTLQSALKDIGQERTATKREQGQFALSELQRLRDERAQQQQEAQRLAMEQERIRISRGNLRLSRKRERHAERERRYDRRHGGSTERGPDTVHSQSIKDDIITLRAQYERMMHRNIPMSEIAAKARKNGWKESVINAASSLASRGYIPKNGLEALHSIGVRHIPREWRTAGSGGRSGGGGVLGIEGIRG